LDLITQELPAHASVIGLGGGRALDVAKYLTWRRPVPLFQVPTSTSVNAAFAQRAAVRVGELVRYVGWAVPEAVYVDFDVIRRAPDALNRSGVGDIFCYHTAHWDWDGRRARPNRHGASSTA
jgi:glycerol-1-phosphate dehydrogenase [NAD(P)+]